MIITSEKEGLTPSVLLKRLRGRSLKCSLAPFEPFFRHNHLLTIAGSFWPRDYSRDLFPGSAKLIQSEPDVQVLAYVQEPRTSPPLGDAIILHGLEGSHLSGYMISMAQTVLRAGFRSIRLNMRTCGGSEAHCRTLYHAGLTCDLAAVVQTRHREVGAPIFLIGYSLGGNVALKFAGESGESLRGVVAGVVSISTPIDLAACCREMMRPENRIYEWRFLGRLKDRYRKRCAEHPDLYRLDGLDRIRSVYEFDDKFTAPHFGFGNAEGYYGTQSAQNFLADIAVPTLMIQAEDDPLIPFAVYNHPAITSNPNIRLVATHHGGHVGFISKKPPRFWADEVVRDWILEQRNKL